VPPVCTAITLSPAVLPGARVAVAYSQTITGSGGTAPYTFTLASGALPAGLTLTTAGVLAGTPTTAGSTTFTIRGTDANGCFATVTYTVVVAPATTQPPVCPAITITPASLNNGALGVPYNQTLIGSGGTAPYVFGVTVGTLPAGLTLTAAGLLAGTPLSVGTTSLTIRGTDANGCFAERPYFLTILAAVPTLPQAFALLLAVGLASVGYLRLRRRARTD